MSTEEKPNNALSDEELSKVGGGADNPNDSTMVKYRCNETKCVFNRYYVCWTVFEAPKNDPEPKCPKCGSTNVEMYWEGM